MATSTLPSTFAAFEGLLTGLVSGVTGQPPRGIGLRRLAPSPVDARVFLSSAPAGPLRDALLAVLADQPAIEDARLRGTQLTLRLAQEHVDLMEAQLAEHAGAARAQVTALAGRSFVVNFLNPNATKPLHIGHLRNATLGHALAATLKAAGARVVRQSYVCDIGRNVCEAVAGWELFHGRRTPAESGLRPDVFVGKCYADYCVSRGADAEDLDPVANEARELGDPADLRIRAWLAGDAGTLADWRRVRGWALEGQAATLARLGVEFDCVRYESDSLATVRRLVEHGLATGVLRREPGGAVVFPTGKQEYGLLPLVRSDGFPTEHARVIALFVDEQAERADVERWIVVCGDEWGVAGGAELDVAARLAPCPLAQRVQVVTHGMVLLGGSKMKSRDGRALLLDELLDLLESEPRVRALAQGSAGLVSAAEAAQLLARGFFLCRKPGKAIEFDGQALLDEVANPAWALTRAWCRAAPGGDEREDPELVRSAVLQVYQLQQLLGGAAEDFRPTEIAKLGIAIAAWSLEQPPSRRLHAAVRAVLGAVLGALGLGRLARVT